MYMTNLCAKEGNKDSCEVSLFCKWNGDVVDCQSPNTDADVNFCGSPTAAVLDTAATSDTTDVTATTDGLAIAATPYLAPFWNTKQCFWSCPVMPTTAPDTCTHTTTDVTNQDRVNMCSGITIQKVCEEDKCFWNLPEPV
jgi:hypothetical protein